MQTIQLTRGAVAIVDDEDFERLSIWKWQLFNNGYAGRQGRTIDGIKEKPRYMHRCLLSPPAGPEVDHVNGNRLDNRRSNLRIATRQQNGMNKSVSKNNKLGIKGVSFDPSRGKFSARITVAPKYLYLGRFDTADEARVAYESAATKHYGEFARITSL